MRVLLTAGVMLAVWLLPDAAGACQCNAARLPCRPVSAGSAVFVGTVQAQSDADVDSTGAAGATDFHFSIDEAFGDLPGREITVRTGHSACDASFEVGASYLVYATRERHGRYRSEICSRTRPLEWAENDIFVLRQLATGTVVSRVFGAVWRTQLRMDGRDSSDPLGPVAGVTIDARGSGIELETVTNAAGRFVFEGLPPGSYTIEPRLRPGLRLEYPAETIRVSTCGAGDISFAVHNDAPLAGVVRTPDGTPVGEGVPVDIISVDPADPGTLEPGEHSTSAPTDIRGRWRVHGLPPGRYIVGVNALWDPDILSPYTTRYYPSGTRLQDAVPVDVFDNRQTWLDVRVGPRIPSRAISGVVVDDEGSPMGGVSIRLSEVDHPDQAVQGVWATTGGDGRFTVRALEGARYIVKAVRRAEGHDDSAARELYQDTGDVVDLVLILKGPAQRPAGGPAGVAAADLLSTLDVVHQPEFNRRRRLGVVKPEPEQRMAEQHPGQLRLGDSRAGHAVLDDHPPEHSTARLRLEQQRVHGRPLPVAPAPSSGETDGPIVFPHRGAHLRKCDTLRAFGLPFPESPVRNPDPESGPPTDFCYDGPCPCSSMRAVSAAGGSRCSSPPTGRPPALIATARISRSS